MLRSSNEPQSQSGSDSVPQADGARRTHSPAGLAYALWKQTAVPGVRLTMVLVAVQVGVFSATLPPEALEITRKFMNKPVSPRM